MKAFRSLRRQESLASNAHDLLHHCLNRAPQRHLVTSANRAASRTTPQFAPFTFRPFRSPLLRRPTRFQHQARLKSTKESPSQSPHQPPSASPSPNPTPNLNSPPGSLSISQRFRKLTREYGWSALGVYLLLSALDFPFCFAAVRMLGVDRIGHWEHIIVSGAKEILTYPFPNATFGNMLRKEKTLEPQSQPQPVPVTVAAVPAEGSTDVAQPGDAAQEWSWGVEEADEANTERATIWTQLALAYAIHKSFIFLRVPLTAAVTPKVVKVLRGWGWNIGKRKPKPSS